jgi:hypothetical protein
MLPTQDGRNMAKVPTKNDNDTLPRTSTEYEKSARVRKKVAKLAEKGRKVPKVSKTQKQSEKVIPRGSLSSSGRQTGAYDLKSGKPKRMSYNATMWLCLLNTTLENINFFGLILKIQREPIRDMLSSVTRSIPLIGYLMVWSLLPLRTLRITLTTSSPDDLSMTNNERRYTLEIAFTPDQYSKLVNVSLTKTKKALTEYSKGIILEKLKEPPKEAKEDWRLYVE